MPLGEPENQLDNSNESENNSGKSVDTPQGGSVERQGLQNVVTPQPSSTQSPTENATKTPPTQEEVKDAVSEIPSDTTKEIVLKVYENTSLELPKGPAKYLYIAQGIKNLMDEDPSIKDSKLVQLGYAFCLFFGKLGGTNSSANDYASFIANIYNEERLSKDEIQKQLDEKYGGDRVLLKDSYLKCVEELRLANERKKQDPENQKINDEVELLTRKLEELKKRLNALKIDPDKLRRTKKDGDPEGFIYVDKELGDIANNYAELNPESDNYKKIIVEEDDEGFINSKLSVEYVVKTLGISGVEGNDPDRLYAKFLNSKYSTSSAPEKQNSLYRHLQDPVDFMNRAKQQTLAVNTVVFFSTPSTLDLDFENKSFIMVGIVCHDHKIKYQTDKGLQTFDFGSDDNEDKKNINIMLGMGFKGAFEPEESIYNEDIMASIQDKKLKDEEKDEENQVTNTEEPKPAPKTTDNTTSTGNASTASVPEAPKT